MKTDDQLKRRAIYLAVTAAVIFVAAIVILVWGLRDKSPAGTEYDPTFKYGGKVLPDDFR